MCQHCKRYGKAVQATTVHHIKHADEYPELAYEDKNLVSLCEGCHNKQHPEKATAARVRCAFRLSMGTGGGNFFQLYGIFLRKGKP